MDTPAGDLGPLHRIDPSFEAYLRDPPRLSYASDTQGWLSRGVTAGVERALGRHRIEGHYFALKARGLGSQRFFVEALERSGITVDANVDVLDALPADRPVIYLANHPFGVVDGLILCNLALRAHGDFRVVINALLCQDRELARHFLPIDFSGTRAAERRNVRAKQLASEALERRIPVVLFPSGMVSTANRFGFGSVRDAPWTTFAAKLVHRHRPTVVPAYFHGRNSRPFHIASHIAEPLRMAMLMHEALRRFDTRVQLDIGDPLPPGRYGHISGRRALTDFLYRQVQETGARRRSRSRASSCCGD